MPVELEGIVPALPPEQSEEPSRGFTPYSAMPVELEGIVPALPPEQSEEPSRGFNPLQRNASGVGGDCSGSAA